FWPELFSRLTTSKQYSLLETFSQPFCSATSSLLPSSKISSPISSRVFSRRISSSSSSMLCGRPFDVSFSMATALHETQSKRTCCDCHVRFRSEEHTSELQSLRHLVCR